MNAHPHSVPLATTLKAPALPEASGFAQHLIQAARILVPMFEAGTSIEAAEIAQILMLSRYGALMQRQAPSPQTCQP